MIHLLISVNERFIKIQHLIFTLYICLSFRKRFIEVPPDPRTKFEICSEMADKICPPPCMSEVKKIIGSNEDTS